MPRTAAIWVSVADVEAEMLDVRERDPRGDGAAQPRSWDPGLDITALNLFTLAAGKIASMQTFPSDLYALDRFWGPPR